MDYPDIRFSSSSIDDFFKPQVRTASTGRIRVAGLSDLSGFQFVADDKLVRISQQDFWKLDKDNDGYFVERLVDDTSGPVQGS